ncbi:L-threonine aldolase [Marinicauda pacifica]|uniref:L-threonine aldolase n=1 Tax=Marinicauda pacifica TaxID=1133559 RepID=A0A4S2HA82_9PROT|nr:beta-eliminating lyase-related protein [Marinicauda pacifica]TGY92824.1 threonine aldolase [Marinicauda pacifica]GGE40629.1 L-threonine aldolase [Marinicauda pacifica]
MNFLSDTTAPAHPAILKALGQANEGFAASYGNDEVCERVTERLREIFETDLEVLFTTSGTASNALALSALAQADSMILCHEEAHIQRDERGAPEFFTRGAKLLPLHGKHARLRLDGLHKALAEWPADFVHSTPPSVLSLSQLNEAGCTYAVNDVRALALAAHERGLFVHMDGARFANALVTLDVSPAEMSWKAGVDALCLGATKNGAMMAEAVILFPSVKDRLGELKARQKRAGHMLPKMRFVAAQFEGWLANDLWLELARKANANARRLSEGLSALEGASLAHPVEGNEVFVHLPEPVIARLREAGAGFYAWPDGSARFVASWCTTEDEVETLLAAARV